MSISQIGNLLVFTSLALSACAQSQTSAEPGSYIAYKTSQVIEIDGSDQDQAWEGAKWTDTFMDIEGTKKPGYETKVKMLWDDTYFYVLAKMEEPHVWGDITEPDAVIFHNNDFEVFIDPDGDTHHNYELEINALNTVWDLFLSKPYRDGNVVLNDWTLTGLKSAVKVIGTLNDPRDEDQGWILELAIPWKAYKKGYYHQNVPANQFWRVNFSRVNWDFELEDGKYKRKKGANNKLLHEYNWVWSPMGVINMHEPEKWGYVYFSSKSPGEKAAFEIPDDERIKWKMYELYRAQKEYHHKNQKWATSLDSLHAGAIQIKGYDVNPTLEHHKMGWNIWVESPFSGKQLIIREDGEFTMK